MSRWDSDDTVGFVGDPTGLRIALPPCYPKEMRSKPSLDDALTLFRVLRRYRQAAGSQNAVKTRVDPLRVSGLADADSHDLTAIEAGFGLAEDYRKHGLLQFREMRVHNAEVGEIDWPHTINHADAIPTGRSVIYAEPARRNLASRPDHPITQLHAATVRDVFCRFFGERSDLQFEPPRTISIHQQLRAVSSKYRGRLYQERPLPTPQLIEAYWGQARNSAGKARSSWQYTEKFEVIWEEMCRKVIGGALAETDAWPSGKYIDMGGGQLGKGLRLVPDFVRRVGQQVIVFDAKFYTSGNLPDSYSILKQLAYGLFLSREWHDNGVAPDCVTHFFLFPKLQGAGCVATLRGQHLISPAGFSQAMAAPIFLLDLDYLAIANAYLQCSSVDVNILLHLAKSNG